MAKERPEAAHDLPSGAWVLTRDNVDDVRNKDRKKVMRSIDKAKANGEGDIMAGIGSAEVVMALCVLEWSYDAPIPSVNVESLDELTTKDWDALSKLCEPMSKALFPNSDGDDVTDKDSFTGPSTG